jgi:hypothetical protein
MDARFRGAAGDTFNRTYIMFGLFIVLIQVVQQLSAIFVPLIFVGVLLPVLLFAEDQLSTFMTQITVSSTFHATCPYFLLVWAPIYLALGIGGSFALLLDLNPDTTFIATYSVSLLASAALFLAADAAKAFLLGLGLISFKLIRHGFFGVFERFFIVVRNLIVLPIWFGYFAGVCRTTLVTIVYAPRPIASLFYLVSKCFLQLWLLFEFGSAFADYRANAKSAFHSVDPGQIEGDCIVCMDKPVEPVRVQCGHVFCYECAFKWLSEKTHCPLCRTPLAEKRVIEFSDGRLSLPVLFFTF